jgi:hypothetical protein
MWKSIVQLLSSLSAPLLVLDGVWAWVGVVSTQKYTLTAHFYTSIGCEWMKETSLRRQD